MAFHNEDPFKTEEAEKALMSKASHAWLDAAISAAPGTDIRVKTSNGMTKSAADVVSASTPLRVREAQLTNRIAPSKGEDGEFKQYTREGLDYYYVRMYELDTPGAYSVPLDATMGRLEASGQTYSIYTHRYRSIPQMFDIRTLEFYNQMTDVDVQKVVLDSSSLDLADVFDADTFGLFKAVVGAVDSVRPHGHVMSQHLKFTTGFNRLNLFRAMKQMKRLPSKFPVAAILVNTVDADELAAILTHEYAGTLTTQLLINGIAEMGKINGISILITSKDSLCPEGTVWFFSKPEVLAAHIIRREVIVHVDKPDMTKVVLEEMFEAGFAVPGVNAVIRADFTGTDDIDPYIGGVKQ